MDLTEHLRGIVARGRVGDVKTWTGPTPVGATRTEIAAAIFRAAGLAPISLQPLAREDAEIWLALFAMHSLLHGGDKPSAETIAQVRDGLTRFGENAHYFGEGTWEFTRRGKHFEPVRASGPWMDRRYHLRFSSSGSTTADVTACGGLVGFTDHAAFAFWVAETD